jgi:hypothetical protein
MILEHEYGRVVCVEMKRGVCMRNRIQKAGGREKEQKAERRCAIKQEYKSANNRCKIQEEELNGPGRPLSSPPTRRVGRTDPIHSLAHDLVAMRLVVMMTMVVKFRSMVKEVGLMVVRYRMWAIHAYALV